MKKRTTDERVIQATVGISILVLIGVIVPCILIGWHSIPGLLGETLGTIIGVMTTPFFMETSFIFIGMAVLLAVNARRRSKDGDDFVYLEEVSGTDATRDMPERARWAIYREKPLDPVIPTRLEQAEGAFAIGDYAAATQWIGAMEIAELMQQDTLRLRLDLAKATGKTDVVKSLEREMENRDTRGNA